MNPQTERAAAIVEQYGCKTENLIAILQDIQAAYNYLSEANLTLVAQRLGISVSKVYSVATFYENFSLEAKGKHIIKVCAGTACHVRKSGPIYDAIYEYPVSYTHLRAHETRHDLVCRLLLEKKKTTRQNKINKNYTEHKYLTEMLRTIELNQCTSNTKITDNIQDDLT